jgi:hypothetical protein
MFRLDCKRKCLASKHEGCAICSLCSNRLMCTAVTSKNRSLPLFALINHLALMKDEAKTEAGRLQQMCIGGMAANDPSYLKGVCISIGVYSRGKRHTGRVSKR